MKNIKCKLRKKLRIRISFKFFLTRLRLKDFPRTINIIAKAKQAIIKRQKAIENASKFCRNLMKMAAVPKRTPAIMPSVKASFLVLTRILEPFSLFNCRIYYKFLAPLIGDIPRKTPLFLIT
jgi:hypothetical protein